MAHVTRRGVLAGIGLSIPAMTMMTACGGGKKPGGAGSSSELSAWILTGAKEKVFQDSFDRWNEKNPDDKFTTQSFANDAYKEKIRTAVGAGNAPTLILTWGGGTMKDYAAHGDIVDLTGKVDGIAGRTIESIMQVAAVDGKQYGVPNNDTQPVFLYYNKDLFEQNKVTPPTTWTELMAAVETFKGAGIIPIALAGSSVWPELMWIEYLADRIGGEGVFQKIEANEKDAWSDPAITSSLEKIVELVDAGAFGDGFGSVTADSGADCALVHTGKAAMLLQGSWNYGTFKQDAPDFVSGGKLGYLTFPTVDGGTGDPANIVGNPNNYWSASAKADEAVQTKAIEYLNDYNLDDAMVADLVAAGVIPSNTGVEDELAASDDADYLTSAYTMVQNAPHFQLSWDQALESSQSQQLLDSLSQVFLGQLDPAGFVTAMNATIK